MGLFTPKETEYEKYQKRIEGKRAKQTELEQERRRLESELQTAILEDKVSGKIAAQIKEVSEALALISIEINTLETAMQPHKADYLRNKIQECEALEQKYNQELAKLRQAFEKKEAEYHNAQREYWEQRRVPSSLFDKARNERERLAIELEELEQQAKEAAFQENDSGV
ncbi:hypothetical protein [Paenibacillus hamazuiensis]|uniref:hypothetical protein n=1 Tax=Paenibacillus hamazuiensis TaxID=2936508 RepID=UPI00200E2348|nr:hypothetical protein [Paenibacillus hamazuiensis]